ncbi:hypothetical protein CIPAW_08G028400 [Carya illinoinensis]|uniref:Uncharacterized protein n=1 Tax=Carya illinoinensis TaxID=32201 RepID=A0A8T1PI19_CARIL|nr:hypothetical protein CIPAW_08G028400 [Carya illinoinensis]
MSRSTSVSRPFSIMRKILKSHRRKCMRNILRLIRVIEPVPTFKSNVTFFSTNLTAFITIRSGAFVRELVMSITWVRPTGVWCKMHGLRAISRGRPHGLVRGLKPSTL